MKEKSIHNFHSEDLSDLIKSGVYTIEHISIPEKYYVGSTKISGKKRKDMNGFWYRWRSHLSLLRTNSHPNKRLQDVVNEYGVDGIRFSIIETIDYPELCVPLETFWITMLNSFSEGYNMCPTGNNKMGVKMSKCTKIKIGFSNRNTNKYKREVFQFNLNGSCINKFNSIVDAEKSTGINRILIRYCCVGVSNKSKGFIWLFNQHEIKDRLLKILEKGEKSWKARKKPTYL